MLKRRQKWEQNHPNSYGEQNLVTSTHRLKKTTQICHMWLRRRVRLPSLKVVQGEMITTTSNQLPTTPRGIKMGHLYTLETLGTHCWTLARETSPILEVRDMMTRNATTSIRLMCMACHYCLEEKKEAQAADLTHPLNPLPPLEDSQDSLSLSMEVWSLQEGKL